MNVQNHDRIRVSGLELECIIGVRPTERIRPQRIGVDLELVQDLSPAGRSGRISDTVDYSRLAEEVAMLLKFRAYRLLEEASEEVAAMVLGVHPRAVHVTIRLEKPAALRGRARAASVEIQRTPEHFPSERRATAFGDQAVLLRTSGAELKLLTINPGAELEAFTATSARLEWLASGAVVHRGRPVPTLSAWRCSREPGYSCVGEVAARVFSCTTLAV